MLPAPNTHSGTHDGSALMRRPPILDVLRAVTALAPGHPEVAVWWYAPPVSLRLRRELPPDVRGVIPVDVVVEPADAAIPDCGRIAAELTRRLAGYPASVRLHRGAAAEQRLYRLVSRGPAGAEAWQ
jgi:hypothetical protein